MRVQEIMSQNVAFGSPQTNAAVAAEIMWKRNCGSLPLVEDGERVVGIVTDRDLFIALGTQNRRAAELTLGEIIRHAPIACAPGDDVRDVLKKMAKEKIHRMPVVNESGRLNGILSIDDVLARADSSLIDEAIRTLKEISSYQMLST